MLLKELKVSTSNKIKMQNISNKNVLNPQDEVESKGFEHCSTKYFKQGKWLRKEMHDLKVEVSDIPKEWKKKTDLLKIEVSKVLKNILEEVPHEVEETWDEIKDSRVLGVLIHEF